MYTYIISFLFFTALVLMIFRNSIRQKLLTAVVIAAGGIFLSVAAVNYILDDQVTYEEREVKSNKLSLDETFTFSDSITIDDAPIAFYSNESTFPSKKRGQHFIYVNGAKRFLDEVSVNFFNEGDTINIEPIAIKFRNKPISNSKWVYTLGLPQKDTRIELWFPADSIYKEIATVIEFKRNNHEKN